MESNNVFSGMNSDNSKIVPNNNKYSKALNFRPTNNLGESNGSLNNILGNNCELTFPQIRSVYKLRINKIYIDGVFQPGLIKITINGNTTVNIQINESTTILDIVTILRNLSGYYDNKYNTLKTFALAYNNTDIIIYQNPEYRYCSSNSSTEPIINIQKLQAGSELLYVNKLGISTSVNSTFIPSLRADDNIIVIGSTYINDINYLYTCSKSNSDKTGQIWELKYDENSETSTLKLLVNNYLNFNINNPIPPTATIGRYEIPSIQRIYWSDFSNPVRSINVVEENLMALDLSLVDLKSSVDMSIPTLKEILDTGAVDPLRTSSTYQFSYRLSRNNGSVTNYSTLSNIVTLIEKPTDDFIYGKSNFASIAGSNTLVNKQIKWEILGVDTNYDTIECIIITRDFPNENNFKIYKFDELLINGDTKEVIFSNDTNKFIEISESEFLIENSSFTHAKTIEQKDNRLFYGNIKNSLNSYLQNYDTRTYRFGFDVNQARVKQFTRNTNYKTITINTDNDYKIIAETDDNIPIYNLGLSVADDNMYNNSFKYKKNSTTIGGEGPNIKYSFGNLLFRSDYTPNAPAAPSGTGNYLEGTTRDDNASSQIYRNGYRRAAASLSAYSQFNPYFKNGSPDQKYYTKNSVQTMGLEYYSGNFRSYQLNEIYRFGIVFKSTNGTSYFTKWIGDIKFPNYNDLVDPNLLSQTEEGLTCSDFRSLFMTPTGAYLNVPYINFEVNIPEELSKHVSSYEIVRIKRNENDRSIVNTGLISQIATGAGSEASNFYLPISNNAVSGGANALDPPTTFFGDPSWPAGSGAYNLISYHPFDSLVTENSQTYNNGDKLVLTEKYNNNTPNSVIWPSSGGPGPSGSFEEYYNINKYYNLVESIYNNDSYSTTNQRLEIIEAHYVPSGGETSNLLASGGVYKNYNYMFTGVYDSRAYAVGSPTIILGINAGITPMIWEDYDVVNNDNKLLALHFKPSILNTQYGGNSYIARSNNEYISTGAFYKIKNKGLTTIKVFGGDIFYGIQDTQKAIKNFGFQGIPQAPTKHSQTWFFPTQSIYNVDLRRGFHVNADLNTDDGTGASGVDEYLYDQAYSYENTLNTYLPQPFNFNDTSIYQNRITWSEVKINGETEDSWTNIPVNNFYDVDGNYGGINSLITLKNNMYFLQDSATGILYINPTSIITDQNNLPLKLGNGSTVEKHFYHSVDIGSRHQWSISKSNDYITFCDIRHKKLYTFDGQTLNPISDTKGNRGILNRILHNQIIDNDNPIINLGILTTYDYLNNEFIYTFLNKISTETIDTEENPDPVGGNRFIQIPERYSIAYSDLINDFSSFYSFTPYIYINNHNKLFSLNDYDQTFSKIYMHNKGNYCQFYDDYYPSQFKVIINPNIINTKVFDNLSWLSESIKDNKTYKSDILTYNGESDNINILDDTFNQVRIYNEYQNTDWINLNATPKTGNLRKTEQGYNIQMPRNKVNWNINNINNKSIFDESILTKSIFGDRIRDKYIIVDLSYNNTGNRFIVHNLKTTYRISDR